MSNQLDVVVIGSGPGGYVAAGRAAQLGLKTAIVEQESLGGVCLNWGCIPTKALLECAHVADILNEPQLYGLQLTGKSFDFGSVVARSRMVADRMSKGIGFLMKQRGVAVLSGRARLEKPGKISVTANDEVQSIDAKSIIIATGASPASLPGIPFDGEKIIHYRQAMTLPQPPRSMIVIGAGAIGMEFADFYRSFGSEIIVIEMMPEILPNEDAEIVKELHRSLRRKKIQTYPGTKVTSVKFVDGEILVSAEGPRGSVDFKAEKLLVATGVKPNTEAMGLEENGIEFSGRFIRVDNRMRTNVPGIYAIGDVAGPPMLAHKASAEALVCIEGIVDPQRSQPLDYGCIPGCTYCKPQVASVGLTEKKVVDAGIPYIKGMFPFRANGMSVAMNETEGIVKLIFHKESKQLLGAHILHAHASDLIGECALAISLKATAHDIARTVHAHPTLAEAVMEAAAAALGEAVHI